MDRNGRDKPDAPNPRPAAAPSSQSSSAPIPATQSAAARTTETKVSAPSFSRVQASPPALPKGGGAIRAIGETFQANAATGTGSMSIPLGLPGGRGGAAPSLSLTYDSGAGNGVFGLGWSVGIGAVRRKTDRGVPEYRDEEETDIFQLEGVEDLVPARVLVDSEWVPDRFETPTHFVERYRPRVEAVFSRIERWTAKADRQSHWVVTSASNVRSTFGASPTARIADPSAPWRVFSWLLERVEDDRGNVVTYEYAKENLDNIDQGAACEVHRKTGQALFANCHPKRIRWGNTKMHDDTTAMFEVVFDYGEHDANVPTPEPLDTRRWACRQDAFSSYRSGFEVRTYRLCKRILVFHRFPELGEEPCLVRSIDLEYDEGPAVTMLRSVTAAGYVRNEDGSYAQGLMPPFELSYTLPTHEPTFQRLEADAADRGRLGELGGSLRWIDLDGEGLPGLLARTGEAFSYARNLGQGRVSRARTLPGKPSLAALAGSELMDVDGDGALELVHLGTPPGFQDRLVEADDWGPFRPFMNLPNVDWSSAQVRLIDLNGDGRDDLFIVTRTHYVYYPSKGKEGFGAPRMVPRQFDETKGPNVPLYTNLFAAVTFADMTGDGLADLVRVEATRIVYWPSLGNGYFGPMVVMSRSPQFEPGGRFDGRRVRFADLNGTGTTDLLYLGPRGLGIYFNQAGNSWSEVLQVAGFPAGEAMASLSVIDVRGNGTACAVWVTGRGATTTLHCLDVVGDVKPYLLSSTKNNLGLETRVRYAASTKFYLADREAGRPWATRLPFPVQVVESVESYDSVARTRFTKRFSYHHGAYDPDEREFRGFGLVETWDTEAFAAAEGRGLFPDRPPAENGELPLPPVRTKTWFHTGIWRDEERLESAYRKEYYSPVAPAPDPRLLPECVLPQGFTLSERQQATRALKGTVLREENYADDGAPESAHPYSVVHHRHEVQPIQRARQGKGRTAEHGVFRVHEKELVTSHYERSPDDPRVAHALNLEVDEFGTVRRAATIAYGRAGGEAEQQRQWVALSENDVVHLTDSLAGLRLAIPLKGRLFELHGLARASAGSLLPFEAVSAAAQSATKLSYEQPFTDGVRKRVVANVKTRYYDSANLPNPLPLGEADLLGLPYESYALALTPGLLSHVFGADVSPEVLSEGGYVELPGELGSWAPSGRALPDEAGFYVNRAVVDPFGNEVTVGYDPHLTFVSRVTDPLGNTTVIDHDYRVLAPRLVTDPNGNRSGVKFDALGMVVATAVMGKEGSTDGDTLEDPTTTLEYDLLRWRNSGGKLPSFAHARAREQHGPGNARFQESFTYSDGSGRVAMAKGQAEPGEAPLRDADGVLLKDPDGGIVLGPVEKRWVGSGKTVVNNKGLPIKQYEPFFSSTHEFEDEDELVRWGVTPVLAYDPVGRLIRTELPHGGIRRLTFTPWEQTAFDENDTAAAPDNEWFAARQPSAIPPPSPEEQRAAKLTFAHRDTPTTTRLDSLGRPYLAIERLSPTTPLETRTQLDIEGQALSITDALGRMCVQTVYGVDGQVLRDNSIDSGERRRLTDVIGAPLRSWDAMGQRVRPTCDALRRPTHVYVLKGDEPERLASRTVYGESYANPEQQNLCGRTALTFDGAGLLRTELFDFKGNPLSSTRALAREYKDEPDWTVLGALETPGDVLEAAESLLEAESFTKSLAYDALNRVTSATFPDASVIVPGYNEAGLLETVDVRVRGAEEPTHFVRDIDYNAKGQRELIQYGNGTTTSYTYDPLTFRLTNLSTTRAEPNALLQNLFYTYDCVGNIVAVEDTAQQTVFFGGQVVEPSSEYEYDALYRLTVASGREHRSNGGDAQRDQNDAPLNQLPHANDAQALRRYEERFAYDGVGNIFEFIHDTLGTPGSWTRRYRYGAGAGDGSSNQLQSTSMPGDDPDGSYSAKYPHDANGNMVAMPHLASVAYTHGDQMRSADLGGGGLAFYTYDGSGERVRKVIERIGAIVEERVYLGGYEVYRKRDASGVLLERQTLHVMDDTRRIAMVETKTADTKEPASVDVPRVRFQYGNHLASAMLECDDEGLAITYEEYHPYGTTAYRSARNGLEVSEKRYRYTGKERDEETGLYYHGARYYACWLGRWTSADPAGMVDGTGLYAYCRGSPVHRHDVEGLSSIPGNVTQDLSERPVISGKVPQGPKKAPAALKKSETTSDGRGAEDRQPVPPTEPVPTASPPSANTSPPVAPASPPAAAAAVTPSSGASEFWKGVSGFAYGVVQTWTPGGFLAPSPLPKDRTFEFWRGAGQFSAGAVELFAGFGLLGGGGAATGAGLVGALPTGGLGLVLSGLGVGAVAIGWAAVGQGVVGIGAGLDTMAHAVSLSTGSGGGGSGPPSSGSSSSAPPSSSPPAQPVPSAPSAVNLTAGKNFKDHFISKRSLLERALGTKVGPLKDGGGDRFLNLLTEGINSGTFKYVGRGTLNKGSEVMNIYRGKGLTVVTKGNGEWVTLLEAGQGRDLAIRMLP